MRRALHGSPECCGEGPGRSVQKEAIRPDSPGLQPRRELSPRPRQLHPIPPVACHPPCGLPSPRSPPSPTSLSRPPQLTPNTSLSHLHPGPRRWFSASASLWGEQVAEAMASQVCGGLERGRGHLYLWNVLFGLHKTLHY